MSSNRNDYAYSQQFVGNLHTESEAVPVMVNTNLRIMTEEKARVMQRDDVRPNRVPLYHLEDGESSPLHPSVQAIGRHYFTW
jgi:predicted metal-dependent phosphotriesterase family hydrolase